MTRLFSGARRLSPLLIGALLITACTQLPQGPTSPQPTTGFSTAPIQPGASATPSGTPVSYTTLTFNRDFGPGNEPTMPNLGHRRIRTQAALTSFLDTIKATAAGRPTVDFATQEVLAFYDHGGDGCDDGQLKSLTDTGSAITFVYGSLKELEPDPNRACTMIFQFATYDMVAMPRTDKPVTGAQDYPDATPAGQVSQRAVESGANSAIETPKTETVTTDAAWQALYKSHNPSATAPTVDFTKERVLTVWLGNRSSGGYSVSFSSIRETPSGIVARYQESTPPEGSMNTTVITQPYAMVAIPAGSKPVTFEAEPTPATP